MVLLVLLLSLVTELRLLEDDHHGKLQFEIYILFYKYCILNEQRMPSLRQFYFFMGKYTVY